MKTIEEEASKVGVSESDPSLNHAVTLVEVEERPKKELSAADLEYIAHIREAIQTIGDRRNEQAEVAAAPAEQKPYRRSVSSLSIFTNELRNGLTDLKHRSKGVIKIFPASPKPKAIGEEPSPPKGAVSAIFAKTKTGHVQSDNKVEVEVSRPVSCSAIKDFGVDNNLRSSSSVDGDEDQAVTCLLNEEETSARVMRPKYDMATGLTVKESRSPKEQIRKAAVAVHDSVSRGVEKVKEQALSVEYVHHRKGAWSKIEG